MSFTFDRKNVPGVLGRVADFVAYYPSLFRTLYNVFSYKYEQSSAYQRGRQGCGSCWLRHIG